MLAVPVGVTRLSSNSSPKRVLSLRTWRRAFVLGNPSRLPSNDQTRREEGMVWILSGGNSGRAIRAAPAVGVEFSRKRGCVNKPCDGACFSGIEAKQLKEFAALDGPRRKERLLSGR